MALHEKDVAGSLQKIYNIMSSSTFTSIQKQLLEKKREKLIVRYKVTFNQRENTLNEGDKVPLTNQIRQLETEIKEVDAQLQGGDTVSVPTLKKSSIELYNHLKRLPKPQFNELCFYLKEKYGYDLSYITVDKAPAESANQLLELVKQNPQGLDHVEAVLAEVLHLKTAPVETPKPDNQFDKKRLIALLCDCPSLRSAEKRQSILTLLPTDLVDNLNIGYSI